MVTPSLPARVAVIQFGDLEMDLDLARLLLVTPHHMPSADMEIDIAASSTMPISTRLLKASRMLPLAIPC